MKNIYQYTSKKGIALGKESHIAKSSLSNLSLVKLFVLYKHSFLPFNRHCSFYTSSCLYTFIFMVFMYGSYVHCVQTPLSTFPTRQIIKAYCRNSVIYRKSDPQATAELTCNCSFIEFFTYKSSHESVSTPV